MSFRIIGLPAERFSHLFALSDDELAAQGAVRQIADGRNPGYPCRISLTDSNPGDELVLVNYEHHPVDSPYRMRFAIYVRKGEQIYDKVDEVPEQLRLRTLAVRAFDAQSMMAGWELVEGPRSGGRDRTAIRQPARRLSARPLRGAGLLRGAGRAELTGPSNRRHPSRRRPSAAPQDEVRMCAAVSAPASW
jgi:hypothetical protein